MEEGKNTFELIPNGKLLRVTNENKEDYIAKKCHYMAYICIMEQLEAMVEGFQTVIPIDWIKIFTVEELEIAICG